jgi:hypothetical protein
MKSEWLIRRWFFEGTVEGSCVKESSCFGKRLAGYGMTIYQLQSLLSVNAVCNMKKTTADGLQHKHAIYCGLVGGSRVEEKKRYTVLHVL